MKNEEGSKESIFNLPILHPPYSIIHLWPLALYRVVGHSMEPTYRAGDLLLGWKWFKPKVEQAVVAQTPERIIVKRIKRIDGNSVWLEGDNPNYSTDSRDFGLLHLSCLRAVIIAKLS